MRLAIRQGTTFDRELDLTDRDLLIGRAEQNDLVLPDQSQTVSRVHARLRYDDGGYVLTDLNSANGIWVGERRVSEVSLKPGEHITLGTYTLVLQSDGQLRGASETARTGKSDVVTSQVKSRPRVAHRPSRSEKGHAPGIIAFLANLPRPILFGGFSACMIGVMVLGQVLAPARRSRGSILPRNGVLTTHSRDSEVVQQHLAEARRRLEHHEFADGIKQLDQALFVEPHNAEALELKMKANEMKDASTTTRLSMPAPASNKEPAESHDAKSTTEPAPMPEPDRKGTLAGSRSRAANGLARNNRVEPLARPIPQVARRPGESQASWYARDRDMQERYDRAQSALQTSEFQSAIATLAEIEHDEPQYKDVSALSIRARAEQRSMVSRAVDTAEKLEAAGDLPGALAQYDVVQGLDSSMVSMAEDSIRRLSAGMKSAATDALRTAKQYDAHGRIQEAISWYQRAYGNLLDADPIKKTVKDRLDVLGLRQ